MTVRPVSSTSKVEDLRPSSAEVRALRLEEALEEERREHHAARQEINRLRRKVVEHAQSAERARDTVSFRLGAAILRLRSLRGILSLPFEIVALVRESLRRRRDGRRQITLANHTTELIDDSLDDAGRALLGVRRLGLPGHEASVVLMGLASARAYDLQGASRLAKQAVAMDPSPRQLGRAAQILFNAGETTAPAEYARAALDGGWLFSRGDRAKLKVIEAFDRARGIEIPRRRPEPAFEPAPKRLAFIASSALPHHISGYTLRTHNVAQAVTRAGWDVRLASRPGYPWDRADARETRTSAVPYEVDGVAYNRLKGPSAADTPFPAYMDQASRAIERFLEESRPSVVFAASNYMNALPALIAARRAGLPFVYSMRGLWEYTAAAKTPGWEATERFALQRDLETLVAIEADRVLALSEGLRREMIERGVDPNKIRLAPNCVDAAAFSPVPRDERLAHRLGLGDRYVLGFLGSLEHYEGLDDLLEAAAQLVREGLNLAVLIVGEGSASGHLREEVRRLELGDRVVQIGRVPPGLVAEHYSVVDAAVFPRLPLPVCEIVSPLKPLEAMAMAKPVIASSVGALAEMVDDCETGLLFQKGEVRALADAIRRLASDPALGERLGRQARAWVEAERSWDMVASTFAEVGASLSARSPD